MLKRQIRIKQLMLLASDTIAVLLALQVSILLGTGRFLPVTQGFKSIAVGYWFYLSLLFYITDLYNLRRDQQSDETASLIVLNAAIAAAFLTLSFYFYPRWKFGRSFFIGLFFITPGLVTTGRLLLSRLQGALTPPSTLALLGDGPGIEELRKVAHDHKLKVIQLSRLMNADGLRTTQEPSGSSQDGATEFQNAMLGLRRDIVVLGPSVSIEPGTSRFLIDARFSGVTVLDFPSAFQMLSGKLPLNHMDGQWFLSAQGFHFFESTIAVRLKRLFDMGLALALLLVTFPLMPIIAVGIKLSSRGSAFYIQERVGFRGHIFRLFKFRTMSVGADTESPWTMKDDPRVFPFGRLLRLTRLDELPQLINVLKGDMSFVGPRPESLVLVELYKSAIPYYHLRSAVRPGLTGWAQVNYPYGSSVEDAVEKLKYDLHYIQNLSLLFDVQIVLRTFRTVLGRQGSQ
jgi:exopolysaccharide biosynthesis polyprenyl glycosylphosphotransferase